MIFWISSAPSEMKLFGVLGLFAAIGAGVYNLYNAGVGPKDRISEHEIVRGENDGDDIAGDFHPLPDTESRLKELESLRAKGLITQAEFDRKRASIIAEI